MIGLYKDSTFFQLAKIKKGKNSSLEIVKLSSHPNVKQLYIKKKDSFVSGLESSDVIINSISLKVPPKKKLGKILSLQTESLNFLDAEQSITLPVVHRKKNSQSDVTFFTTTKSALKEHLDSWNQHGREPTTVSAVPLALVRYAKSMKTESSLYILHLGKTKTTCVWMENNMPIKAHTIPNGIASLEIALEKNANKSEPIDLLHAKKEEYSELFQALSKLEAQITAVFSSFSEKKPLLVTGQLSGFNHLSEYLSSQWKKFVSALVPESKKEKEFPRLKEYAVSIGLALDGLASDQHSLQFRQKNFTPKKILRKKGLQFCGFYLLTLFLSFFTYFISTQYLEDRKLNLEVRLDQSIKKDNIFSERDPLFALDQPDTKKKLTLWEKELLKESKHFSYYLKTPRVIDILSWLQSYTPSFQVVSFQYKLERYPKIGSLHEPYLTKVHLSLSIESPVEARKFHEVLLKGEGPVLSNKEITWERMNNLYKTSFYLKPHYRYDPENR